MHRILREVLHIASLGAIVLVASQAAPPTGAEESSLAFEVDEFGRLIENTSPLWVEAVVDKPESAQILAQATGDRLNVIIKARCASPWTVTDSTILTLPAAPFDFTTLNLHLWVPEGKVPDVAGEAARSCVEMATLAQAQSERWVFRLRFDASAESIMDLNERGWLYLGSRGGDFFRCTLKLKPGF